MSRYYLFVFLLCSVLNVLAQITQPYRYEKELRFNDQEFMIIPRDSLGIALVRETNTFKAGNRTWEIILLDTTLTEKKSYQIEVDQRKNLLGYEYTASALYLLYGQADNQVRSIFQLFQLENDSVKNWEIKPEINCMLTQFIRVGKNFIFGGYMNNEPTVLLFRPESENLKILPGFFQKDIDLLDLRTNVNNTFSVLLMDRRLRNSRKLILRIYDYDGVELFQNEIQMGDRRAPQTCLVSTLKREDMLIAGTWGVPHSRQSMGFFAVPIEPFKQQEPRLYALGELNHYLDHLNEKKRKRIQEKTKALIKADRLPDYMDNIRPVRLDETANGFILLAEVFLPSSTTSRDPMFYPYPYYPWPYPAYFPYNPMYYPPVFNRWYNPFFPMDTPRDQDNVKVIRSVVLAFDNRGYLLWDHSCPLEDIRLASIEQMSDFYISKDSLFILYKKKSNLHLKKINLQNQEAEEKVIPIALNASGDELRQEKDRDEYVRFWFKNNFYVWGVQSIRNKTLSEDSNRQVFYINAVRID